MLPYLYGILDTAMHMHDSLVLASASPQRKSLLQGLGVEFTTIPSTVDETTCLEREPAKRAKTLAVMKAKDIALQHPEAYVIGCDTLVVASDGTLLEKPCDAQDARRMLQKQSDSASIVHSGVCIFAPSGNHVEGLSSSIVVFKPISAIELDWWIERNEWKDRSGAFQIDGLGQLLIESIEGDWTGIVGLPLFLLEKLFNELGTSLRR